jgi:hypothetical protein
MSIGHRLLVLIVAALVVTIADEARSEKEVFGWNQTAGTNTVYVNDPYYHSLEYYSPYWFEIVRQDTSYVLVSRDNLYVFADMGDFANVVRATCPDTMKIVPMVQLRDENVDAVLDTAAHRLSVIQQIAAVVDTLNFHGINIDFEYPSVARRDSFSVFMAELAEALPETSHVYCAVPAVMASQSITEGFDYGTLADSTGTDLLVEMVYDKYPADNQTGPTSPLWWWKRNADTTAVRYGTSLDRFALAGPTYGLIYNVSGGGNVSRRPRAPVALCIKEDYDTLNVIIDSCQVNHNNNDNNYPMQWSLQEGVPGSYGSDSTIYIPYTLAGADG